MRLDGKLAFITGGASGIGLATALTFADAGAEIVIADKNREGADKVAAEIRESGGNAMACALDITDAAAVAATVEAVTTSHATPDILINCAGWEKNQPFVENDLGYIEYCIRLNLMGQMLVTQGFLPGMVTRGTGCIINVASDAGRVGSPGTAVYSGAKGGVIAFTKAIAREVARHGIRVNCVCPGPTETPLYAQATPERRAKTLRLIPLRRFGQPQDIADALLFFASDRSGYVTGQALSVSGGVTMVD